MDSVIVETPKEAARRFSASVLAKGFEPVALHVYTDVAGAPLYWRIRAKHPGAGEKWIRPLRITDNGYELSEPQFINGKPLYALQRLAENPAATVWIVEGEQKADELNRLGLVATTSGGATTAKTVNAEILRERTVRLWPDNDEAGAGYASDWAEILAVLGCNVTCVDVGSLGLNKGGDAVDWLALNPDATPENIEALPLREAKATQTQKTIQQAANHLPASDRIVALDIDELLQREFPPMEPLLSPWLCKQHLSMVYAWRGVGKTHFALGVAYAVAGGGAFLKWKADKPRRVVYIDGEMAGAAIQDRLAAIVASTDDAHEPPEGYFKIITPDAQNLPLPDLASPEGQAALVPHIADADLIVVDNLSSLMRAGAENEGESWVPVADWALSMRKLGKAVLFIHHAGKGGQQRGSSRREDLMDVVIKLDHARDYEAAKGAAFLVNFEKARHLSGDDAKDIEAALTADEHGVQTWVWKDAELGMAERILALHQEDPKLSQSEIAKELGVNRSTVSRALKKAKQQGGGTS